MTRLSAVSWGRLYLALIAAGAALGAIGGAITCLPRPRTAARKETTP